MPPAAPRVGAAKTLITKPNPIAVAIAAGHGLHAQYYSGTNLSGAPTLDRIDPAINFIWGAKSPVPGTAGPFSVQWTGSFTAPRTGKYTFYTASQGGSELLIDSSPLIDRSTASGKLITRAHATTNLTAGQTYSMELDYFATGKRAAMLLHWAGPRVPVQLLPILDTQSGIPQPTAPATLTATPISAAEIDLTWSDVAGAAGYAIQRSTNGTDFTTIANVGAGTTAYQDTSLSATSAYQYRVVMTDLLGTSDPSSAASATTLPLSAPTSFSAEGVGGGGALFSPSFSPFNANELYVAADMSDLFHSTNLGQSWSTISFQQIQAGPTTRVQFTSDPQILYALDETEGGPTSSTPSKSIDGGQHWTPLTSWVTQAGYNNADSLYADPASTTRLIASDYGTLYFSADGGQTWASKFSGGASGCYIGGVFWDPNGQNIYVGTNNGLVVSNDGGSTFALSSVGGISAGESIVSFAGAQQNGITRLFCVTWGQSDVYPGFVPESSPLSYQNTYTLDVGQANWTPTNTGVGTDHPFSIAAAPNNINIVYMAGTDATASNPTVEKSTNGGASWSDVLFTAGNRNVATGWQGSGGDRRWSFGQEALGFAVSPTDPNTLAFSDFGFVHVSADGGNTWQAAYVTPATRNILGVATPQYGRYQSSGLDDTSTLWLQWTNASDVFAGYTDINGAHSTNGGTTWAFPNFNGLSQNTIYQTSYAPNSGILYAASSSIHDIYQSTHISDASIDGGTGQVLYSTDGGGTWLLLHNFGLPVIWNALDPTNPDRLYVSVVNSTSGGLYVTNDLQDGPASTWTRLASPPRTQGHPFNIQVLNDGSLVCTYSAREIVVNGATQFTSSSGVFVSTDGGQTWSDRTDPSMVYWTKDILIDPTDPSQNTWYAAVRSGWNGFGNGTGGLYKTTDRGLHWTRIFTSQGAESANINPVTREMYVTTTTSGLFYSSSIASPVFQHVTSYDFRQPDRVFFNPYDPTQVWVTSFGAGIQSGTAV